jgi:hypothetical protein
MERRLESAWKNVELLNAVHGIEDRGRFAGEYEKIMRDVASDLEYLRNTFSSSGPLSARVNVVAKRAYALLELIIRSIGLDPDEPGLSERVEIKKAATLGRSRASDVKKVLDGFKLMKGKMAAGADLALTLAILAEVGVALVKKIRSQT